MVDEDKLQEMFFEIQRHYLNIENYCFVENGEVSVEGCGVGLVPRSEIRMLYAKVIEVFNAAMKKELRLRRENET